MNNIVIDLGGTNTRVALVKNNDIIVKKNFSTISDPQENMIEIKRKIDSIGSEYDMVKICSPGPLDSKTGKLGELPNLPTYSNFNLKTSLEELTSKEVKVENDANCAALGESAIRDNISSCAFFTLSTGFGGGFIIDNKVFQGYNGIAFEVHNIDLPHNLPLEDELINIEEICSGTGIYTMAKRLGSNAANTKEVIELYRNKEKKETLVINEFIDQVSTFLVNINYIMNTEIVVIGGSVINFNNDLFELIKKQVNKKTKVNIRLEKAILEDDAGLIGASKI